MRLSRLAVAAALTQASLALGLPATGSGAPLVTTNAKLLAHLSPVMGKNICTSANLSSCTLANTQGNLNTPYFAYLLVSRYSLVEGMAGAQLGLQYDGVEGQGVDVFS